jgi:nitrate reductase gamma subunit
LNGVIASLYGFFVEKLPYITIAVFFIGLGLRLSKWFAAPRETKSKGFSLVAGLKHVFLDVVLFRKTFKTEKVDWLVVFLFHFSVAGILFGHMRGFKLWNIGLFSPLGHRISEFMVHTLPIYMGWIFIATQLILLFRRAFFERKKLMSLLDDYGALILLLVTSILGQGMRIFPPEAIPPETYSIVFIPRFIVLHLEKVPSFHWFFLHVLFTQLFVMYIPFSKVIHVISGVVTSALYGDRRREYGI